MCGRYLIATDTDYEEIQSIIDEVSGKYKSANLANGEIFPTNNVPIIYNYKGINILSSAKWGFPGFKNNSVIINAKSETLEEKPMFRKALFKRCLVPANAFYEWKQEQHSKVKYQIGVNEHGLFFMAGLYDIFIDKHNKHFPAFVIITTSANSVVSRIHNRMPVILAPGQENLWLTEMDISKAVSVFKSYDSDNTTLIAV